VSRRLFILYLALIGVSPAAPSVNKVEPPNWWVRHTRNPIQILLTGADLKGAAVSAAKGFRIEVRHASDDGRYLFLYVTIDPSVRPGSYRFAVKNSQGAAGFDSRWTHPRTSRAVSRASAPPM